MSLVNACIACHAASCVILYVMQAVEGYSSAAVGACNFQPRTVERSYTSLLSQIADMAKDV